MYIIKQIIVRAFRDHSGDEAREDIGWVFPHDARLDLRATNYAGYNQSSSMCQDHSPTHICFKCPSLNMVYMHQNLTKILFYVYYIFVLPERSCGNYINSKIQQSTKFKLIRYKHFKNMVTMGWHHINEQLSAPY